MRKIFLLWKVNKNILQYDKFLFEYPALRYLKVWANEILHEKGL